MNNHVAEKFSLYPDITIGLDLARDTIQFSGNTFPIKDTIKQACQSLNVRCYWDSSFKTWTGPLGIIYTDYLKDIVNIDQMPKLTNSNIVLGDMVNLSRHSNDKTTIQKVILYGEIDKIRDLVDFYGGYQVDKNKFYHNELFNDFNMEYYEFGSDISSFTNKNLPLFRDVFGLNHLIENECQGKGVSHQYHKLLENQQLVKEKQQIEYLKYREKIHQSYQNVDIIKLDRHKDKRGFVLRVQQIITGPENDVRLVYNDILSHYCFIGYGTHIIDETYVSQKPQILKLTLDRCTTTGD